MKVRQKRSARLWAFGILALFAVLIGAFAFASYGSPDSLREQEFVTEKGSMPELWYSILWTHAIAAGTALTIGWLQFVKKIRHRMLMLHRLIGYVYAAMIAVGGVTGLYLAFYASGGWSALVGFASLSILWLFTLYRSLKSIIVERDPIRHGEWMIRNYALSCAAIMLRLYTLLAAMLFGITDTNVSFVVIAWIAWVPNLAVAAWLINRKRLRTER